MDADYCYRCARCLSVCHAAGTHPLHISGTAEANLKLRMPIDGLWIKHKLCKLGHRGSGHVTYFFYILGMAKARKVKFFVLTESWKH